MRPVNLIIIHCSDSPNDREVTAKDIDSWHKERGFKCIGYHYVICRDGKVETGRKESEIGAHCKGYNSRSIGICLVGRDEFKKEQMDSLFKLITSVKDRFGDLEVKGHYELDSGKTCPNLDMDVLREQLIFP